MGKFCEICEKGTLNGNNVSHSNRKTHRTWAPNVQSVRVVVNGSAKRMNVCTRCLRPLLSAFGILVARGTVGALPQTLPEAPPLDSARGNCPLTPSRD